MLNFISTVYLPYCQCFNLPSETPSLTQCLSSDIAYCFPLIPRITSIYRHSSGLRLLKVCVRENGRFFNTKMMMDSGASINGVNARLARKLFPKLIQKLNRPLAINTIGEDVPAVEAINLHVVDPRTKKPITSAKFYLMENLEFDYIAGIFLLKRLGWELKYTGPPFEHKRQPDETFGSCNNWDRDNVKVKFEQSSSTPNNSSNKPIYQQIVNRHLKTLDPHAQYIFKCNNPMLPGTQLHSLTRVHTGTTNVEVPPKQVHHISNYRASKEELERAKQLCKDKKLGPIPLKHLLKRSKWLFDKMTELCTVEFADIFAKHQFQLGTVKNFEFKIDLKDESKGEQIFVPQYHLAGDKRLVVIYSAMKNQENGLYIPDDHSIHNVPILVVPRKDGRYRLAYDLRLLNSHTKEIKSNIPTYNWLFELLQGRGLFTVSDIKNYFECILTRARDRILVPITTPIGRFLLTRGTYGFKNIAAYAQQVSDRLMQALGRAGAFIDDMFIKHPPDATDEELYEIARKFLERCRKYGILLHPEKTYFFVPEIEFLGYIFNQTGHTPKQAYIQRILGIKKPRLKPEIRAFNGLLQYIARYVHRLAEWTHYLTILTTADCKREWGPEQDAAYDVIIDKIKKIGLLYHPTDDGTFLVQTDASNHSISGVLYQLQYDKELKRKQWKLIEFYSKQIDPHLRHHHIGVKECLAISYALNHWKHFLLRKKFYLDTDHRNLVSLYDVDANKAPNMKKQQIFKTLQDATAMYLFELAHLQGKDLILADYLSRDGSKLNSIDDATRGIKLVGPKFENEKDRMNFIMTMQRMQTVRQNIFDDNNSDWKFPDPNDPIIKNAYCIYHVKTQADKCKDKFTFSHLDNLYAKEHGYLTSPQTGDIIESSETLQLTRKSKPRSQKYPATGLKSCLKNKTILSDVDNSETHKLLKSYSDAKFDKFDQLLADRLSSALANTLKQTSKITPSSFYRIKNTFTAYSLNDADKETIPCYPLSDSPNYNIDQNNLRRSTRKRKQTVPHWKQQSAADKLNNELKSSENDDKIEQETDNSISDTQFLEFPFKVNPKLIDSLYDKLYLPEKYNKILSNDNLKAEQKRNKLCHSILQFLKGDTQSTEKYLSANYPSVLRLVKNDNFCVRNDLLYIRPDHKHPHNRLVIPCKLIHALLDYEHCINHLGHPGVQPLIRILTAKYYWPFLHKDVANYVSQCETCLLGKGSKSHKIGRLEPLHATCYGEVVHSDFAGPFFKKLYLLIMVDRYTGVTMILPCYNDDAVTIVNCLLHHWYPKHGMPRALCTDRGSGFISEANRLISKKLGIDKLFTSRYHPQTDAKAERIVQETKKALRMVNITLDDEFTSVTHPSDINHVIKQITLLLPSIYFSINQRIRSMTQVSPHMLIYGRNLNDIVDIKLARQIYNELPSDFDKNSHFEIVKQLKLIIEQTQERYNEKYDKYVIIMKDNYDIDKCNDSYKIGDLVAYYVGDRSATNRKIRRRFTGPWQIIQRLHHNTVVIRNQLDGTTFPTHVCMLKRYYKHQFIPLCEIEKSERAKYDIYKQQQESRNSNKSTNSDSQNGESSKSQKSDKPNCDSQN